MKSKKSRRGFTIVELVIVIAVIGVLAGILIPTFISLTNKANRASDESLITNLNKALAMAENDPSTNGKNNTMHDAIEDLKEYGFGVNQLVTKYGENELLWNQEDNRFYRNVEEAKAENPMNLWGIVASITGHETHSVYANSKFTATTVTVSVGFDAGEQKTIESVTYSNTSGNAQKVSVRTIGGEFTVNAPLDTVKHYGVAKELTITAVDSNSYHEYGTIAQATLSSGRLVIEETGFIGSLGAEDNDENTIEVNGTLMNADANAIEQLDTTKPGTYPGNDDNKIINVGSFDQLQGLAYGCNLGTTFEGYTIRLTKDIDFTGKVWVPFGVYAEKAITNAKNVDSNIFLRETKFFMGNIDGNGHKIINLSNKGYETENEHKSISGTVGANYGLISIATGDIEIKDLEISFDIVKEGEQPLNCVGIIGQYYSLELDPIRKHYKDSNEVWQYEDNERYDAANGTYELKEVDVTFKNIKTSGKLIGVDAMSVFIGTTYVTNHPYTFNDDCVYAYRNSKNYVEGPGQSYTNGGSASTVEQLRSFATSGYYYEGFQVGDVAQKEITFMSGENEYVCLNGGSSKSNTISSFAPLLINYNFENCNNSADVYSGKRAAIYLGKLSHTVNIGQYTINFKNCTNTGNTISDNQYSGIISGFFVTDIVSNLSTCTNGLTNSGTATRNNGKAEQATVSGVDALADRALS